jgi:prevent-host-death family protein
MRLTVSVTYTRRNLSKILDRVERGARIIITRYGKPIAAVVPVSDLELLKRLKTKK